MNRYIFILLILVNVAFSKAQIDTLDTQTLNEVNAYTSYLDGLNTGPVIIKYDSSVLAQNQHSTLGEMLSSEGGVFIKSYGPGNLATSSVRGAGANHTKVLWNGFDISNPMLGQVDFSYLNVNSFDNVSIQFGNVNGAYGSGTQGGVVRLNNKLKFDNSDNISLTLGGGSFGVFNQSLNYKTNSKNVATLVSLNNKKSVNNFNYLDNNIELERENADVNSLGINLSNSVRINQYQKITTNIWYQNNDRGIPAGLGGVNKNERLVNEFLRSSIGWNRYGVKHDFSIKTAYFEEQLNYTNPIATIESISRFKTSITEAEFKKRLDNQGEIIVGSNLSHIQAFTLNYDGNPVRISNAYFIGWNYPLFNNRLIITPSVRKEFVTAYDVPFTGSFGSQFKISNKFNFKGSVSKNYRLPTFNDLYFGNQGNPNLKPEDGWSSELSTIYNSKKSELRVTLFNNDYTNWIAWSPQSNGVWKPQNKNVFTRGAELYANTKWKNYFVRLNTSFTESIDVNTGMQLIYVPLVTASSTVGYQYNNFMVSYNHQYVEERFITTDNTLSLPFYVIGNLNFTNSFGVNEAEIKLGLQINNIFNTTYQAVVNQPMPGRYFGINFSIVFNNKNNKT